MEGRGDKHRETDLICVFNSFQLVDACLQAVCTVFSISIHRRSMKVSTGGGMVAVGCCWVESGVGEVACPEKEVCTTYNIQADI